VAVSQYLTVSDLLTAPLGLSLRNTPTPGSTGPTGTTGAQTYEGLTAIIQRASALADSYTQQVLGATLDTEEKRTDQFLAGIDVNGYLWVHTDYWPVLSVQSFQYGYPAVGGTSWTLPTLTDLIVSRAGITYPAWFPQRGMPPLRVQYSYLNGWPNTLLTGSVLAGATTLPVADATGMVAGGKLTIDDQGLTEQVTIAAGWVAVQGAASVTLLTGTTFAHTPVFRPTTAPTQPYDIAVSALPPDVKQAILLICKELTDVQGANSLVMGRAGGVRGSTGKDTASAEKIPIEAQSVLNHYRRIL